MPAKDDQAETRFDPDAYLEQASRFAGVPVASAYRQGVARNLVLIAQMADLVTTFPLALADEPAPVFVAAEPEP